MSASDCARKIPSGSLLQLLYASGSNDIRPANNVGLEESGQFFGRGVHRLKSQRGQALLDLRCSNNGGDLVMEEGRMSGLAGRGQFQKCDQPEAARPRGRPLIEPSIFT